MSQSALEDRPSALGTFPTTHWSGVLAAGQENGTAADTALAELCGSYWYPVYAFIRRRGYQPADAEDLAQAFFSHLIDRGLVRKADPQKGRFRSFLLGCLTLFVASEAERARALKRGGGLLLLSIDLQQAERRFAAERVSASSPEQLFDRHWAVAVLSSAMVRLEAELKESGRAALFEDLLPSLQGDEDIHTYAEIARHLGTTEGSIRVTAHRLRRRYRDLVRAVIRQTVNDPLDVETEMAHLAAVLRA